MLDHNFCVRLGSGPLVAPMICRKGKPEVFQLISSDDKVSQKVVGWERVHVESVLNVES